MIFRGYRRDLVRSTAVFALAGMFAGALPSAQASEVSAAKSHAELGQAAAKDFPGYVGLCNLDMRMRNVNAPRKRVKKTGEAKPKRQAGKKRKAKPPLPPMQVFDNLFFLGTPGVSAWLYGTEEGYILIDTLKTDSEARTYILGGMRTLGLDPAKIKYILVTHAHGDHYGGADVLAEQLGVPVLMSEPDWQLAERTPPHPLFGAAPERGVSIEDGALLTAGATTAEVYVTPGHTPGTLSPLLTLFDQGVPHKAVLWGGTGFNFGPDIDIFNAYANSAVRMRGIARAADVDVFLSNHPSRDQSDHLMGLLTQRQDGEPHPFVMGEAGYALFSVLEHCALAQAARFATTTK